MTDFADLKTQIMDWTNRQDFSDVLVTSLIRQAEQIFNSDLRIDRMITSADALIASRCAPLPDDWLESDFTRIQCDTAPTGFVPIYYKPRAEFFSLPDDCAVGKYTIEGRQIFIGGAPDTTEGTTVRIDYYQEVPVFSDTIQSYIYTKFPSLYLNATLYRAALHALGEETIAANHKQMVDEMIQKLNAQHRYARASGSRLARTRVRSFG